MQTESLEITQEEVRGGLADVSALALPGLERMRLGIRRVLPPPPIHHLTGLRPTEAGIGTCTFTMPASPWFLTPSGYFSWGTLAWLADGPLGGAVVTILPPGAVVATSDLSMSFLRPATPKSGTLIGRARLIHAGRTLGLAEASIEDSEGRLLGHGTTRCFITQMIDPPPDPPGPLTPYEWPEYPTPDPYLRPAPETTLPQGVWDSMGGLQIIHEHMSGDLPRPASSYLLGIVITQAEEGRLSLTMPSSPWLMSPGATVYGGALAFLADYVIALTLQTTIPTRTIFSPLDLKVNFLRPVTPDGSLLTAHGTVIHRGRSMAVASCEILNDQGKRVAVATSSALIRSNQAWGADGGSAET